MKESYGEGVAIHAQIRKDVLALHLDLGTGLTDGDLLAARTLLLEAEKLSTEKHGKGAPICWGGFGAHAKMPFPFEDAGPRLSPG